MLISTCARKQQTPPICCFKIMKSNTMNAFHCSKPVHLQGALQTSILHSSADVICVENCFFYCINIIYWQKVCPKRDMRYT